jgi:hypothetical protein
VSKVIAVALTLLHGCGRVGFSPVVSGDADDATDATPGTIAWVKPFVGQHKASTGLVDTFTASATQTGDAIVIHLFCETSSPPSAVSISGSGWTFVPLGTITGSASNGFWAASVGAIAPDSASTVFDVSWTAAIPCSFLDELGDEFSGADPTGGTITFDAHAEASAASGNCVTSVTTNHANDAVWSACTTDCVSDTGPGYTKGADDTSCDWSEYKLTSDPPNTPETTTFLTMPGTSSWVITAVTIKPR